MHLYKEKKNKKNSKFLKLYIQKINISSSNKINLEYSGDILKCLYFFSY